LSGRRTLWPHYILHRRYTTASDFESKKQIVQEIGKELYADGVVDAMDNIFYPIEVRVKEEIGKDARPYRSWWNDITKEEEWK
jgi:hypothetical protein